MTAASAAPATYLRTRLGSLLAILPLGVWTVMHLWDNLAVFEGADAWEARVTHSSSPLAQAIVMLVVLGPLLVHTVWGIGRLLTTRPNNVRYGFYANLKYALQRLSAIGLLLFLGAHLWLAMIRPRFVVGHPEPFAEIAGRMHDHVPTLVVYILGVLGTSYHLANGLQTFAMGWGIAGSRSALKKLEWIVYVIFAVLLAMGYAVVYVMWHAGATAH